MIQRPPRSTLERSSAASDVYKRQVVIAADTVVVTVTVVVVVEIATVAVTAVVTIIELQFRSSV